MNWEQAAFESYCEELTKMSGVACKRHHSFELFTAYVTQAVTLAAVADSDDKMSDDELNEIIAAVAHGIRQRVNRREQGSGVTFSEN